MEVQSHKLMWVSPKLLKEKKPLFREARQPLPGILDFGPAGVGIFPEIEEFPVLLGGFGFLSLLFAYFSKLVIGLSIDIAVAQPADSQRNDFFVLPASAVQIPELIKRRARGVGEQEMFIGVRVHS